MRLTKHAWLSTSCLFLVTNEASGYTYDQHVWLHALETPAALLERRAHMHAQRDEDIMDAQKTALIHLDDVQRILANKQEFLGRRHRELKAQVDVLSSTSSEFGWGSFATIVFLSCSALLCLCIWNIVKASALDSALNTVSGEEVEQRSVEHPSLAEIHGYPNDGTTHGGSGDSAEINRELFEENQRAVAFQIAVRAVPLCVGGIVLLLLICFGCIAFYIWGFVLLADHWLNSDSDDKPCDQPFYIWLQIYLLLLPLHFAFAQSPKMKALINICTLGMIVAASWMYSQSETCAETNPSLYQYVQWYLIFFTLVWLLQTFLFFGFVSLVIWMNRRGLLDQGPGPRMAGRSGLIDDIETVPYDRDLFTSQPDECCICQEKFSDRSAIKRTACGHIFHQACLGNWLGKFAKSCPLCRADLEVMTQPSPPSQATVV